MAYIPGVAPWLRLKWDGFNKEELEHSEYNLRLDLVAVPLFLVWYLVLAWLSSRNTTDAMVVAQTRVGAPTLMDALMHIAVIAVAVYVVLLHMLAQPNPQKHQEAFEAQSYFGRWIYLTRHGLTLQAWHQVLSLLSFIWPRLAVLSHSCSMMVGTLGVFVTIQFNLLVVPNLGYKDEVEAWKDKGVQFGLLQKIIHIPALFISLMDILVIKDLELLHASMSWSAILLLFFMYIVIYLIVLMTNFRLTQRWPYKFMNAFGTDAKKWAGFVCMQTATLCIFWVSLWCAFLMRGVFLLS